MKKDERHANSRGSVIDCCGTQAPSGDQSMQIIHLADLLNDTKDRLGFVINTLYFVISYVQCVQFCNTINSTFV